MDYKNAENMFCNTRVYLWLQLPIRHLPVFGQNPMDWVHRTFCHNAIIVQGCQGVISVCFNGRADQNGFRNELNYTTHTHIHIYVLTFCCVFFFFFYRFVFVFFKRMKL